MNTTSASPIAALPSGEDTQTHPTAAEEWHSGWTLVLSSAVAMILIAIPTASLGLFIGPLQEAFGWSRGLITSAILTNAICVLGLSPLVGKVINRHGARRVGLFGLFAVGLAIASVGLSGPSILSWYVAWILVGVTQTFAGPIIWSAAIVRKFNRARGMALAVMLSGTGIATATLAPITLAGINSWGWRATYWAFGASAIVFFLPLVYIMFRDPASTGPVPTNVPRFSASKIAAAGTQDGKAPWRTWRFAKLAFSVFGVALALSTLFVHMVPLLHGRGLSAVEAVSVASVLGVTQLVARLMGGHLLDRYFAPYVGAIMFAMVAGACFILLSASLGLSLALTAGVLTGVGLGLELDLMAYLVSRYFSVRAYATCYGLLLGLYGIGFGAGAVLAGAVFDRVGNYDPILIAMAVVLIGCALLIATLGCYPDRTSAADRRER